MSRSLIPFMDLTRLESHDTPAAIDLLCDKALAHGPVAAICVYPAFVPQVVQRLAGNPHIRIATVVNFPTGEERLSEVCAEIRATCAQGAQEIDLVIPYKTFIDAPNPIALAAFVQACRDNCPNQTLKVILESGAFTDHALLKSAARAAIAGGADFLKTSTGKIAIGATPEAVSSLLEVLAEPAHRAVGLKVSGGVRTIAQAMHYHTLVQDALGTCTAQNFRIGASGLLDAVVENETSSLTL